MILSIRRFSLSRMVLMGAILILILALNTIPSGASSHLSLNEIVVSTSGSDREFFEIAGASGDSLDGVFFLEVTSGGAIDTVLDLSGEAIPADGYWLAASPEAETVLGVTGDFSIANNTLTNISQTYLLVQAFSGASGDDIDADDDGVIDNALWSSLLDSIAVVDDDSPVIYSDNVVGPDGPFLAPGGFRCPDATGDWTMHNFSDISEYTAGEANCAPPTLDLNLNEIVVSTTGSDREFFEIAGASGDSLDGVFFLEVASGGAIDTVLDLSGETIPADGFWLAASPTAESVLGVTGDFSFDDNTLNNTSRTYLLVQAFSGASGDDIDADDDGVIDNTLWASLLDSIAVVDDGSPVIYSDNVVGPDGPFLAPGGFRCPDATGDWNMHDFSDISEYTAGEANACGTPPTLSLNLNEIVVSTTSTDREFFEIAGASGDSLDGVFFLEVTSGGAIDTVLDLSGESIPADGFWLAASPTAESVLGVTGDFSFADNTLTNTSQTYLLVQAFSGASGDDIDADDDGVIDNTLWASLLDSIAVVDDGSPVIYSDNVVGPDGSFLAPGGFRCPDATGDWTMHAFGDTSLYTAGDANSCAPPPPPESCGDEYTPIYTIQGDSLFSSLDGSVVSTEGVVVGDFQDGKSGFYIQDATGDGDMTTSDGIFVFYTGTDVNVGDHVRVRGTVDEFFGLTEITSVSQVLSCGTGSVAPTVLSLPVSSVSDFEAYEGMLVTFPQTLYISEFYNYDRFGEIVLTTDRQYQPTSVFDPGTDDSAALALFNSLNRISLDDGRGNSNPDPAIHPNGNIFNLDNRFRGGDELMNVTGVLDFNFGAYKIQPTQGADYNVANPRPESHDDVGGTLEVAAFNVLNYFTTLDDGENDICGPLGDLGCRGADTAEEFMRQRAKIIAAISAMDADVVGLIEIENHPGDVPTADLVSGLNEAMGAGTYDYIATGAMGSDAIRQAFIYKPASVTPWGAYAVLDDSSFTDPMGYGDDKTRPALAQTFVDNETGGVFTVTVNHFKSKGSPCGLGDDDPEAASCNLTRALGAQALLDWLATDPTGSGDEDFLIIGDLNSYDKEDPIDVLLTGGYTDLLYSFIGEDAYSYVFNGQLGYLDYGLSNDALTNKVTGATAWHINTDEPDIIDYDTSFKKDAQDAIYAPDPYRSSDHDPVIVGLELTTEQEIFEMMDTVHALVDEGYLNRGQGNSFLSKLANVLDKLAKGQTKAATNQLGAFIHELEDFVSEEILTDDQAQPLINGAEAIIFALSE